MMVDRGRDEATVPFLSVLMPVHEGAQWISATLDSLASEPTEGLEIIIIDSSPTDETAAVIRSYADRLPIRFFKRQDLGPWQVKTNVAIELAGADHACMLHQDDLWLSGRVAAIRRWIAEAPEAVLHLAPTSIIDRHGRTLGHWRCPLPSDRLLDADHLLQRLLVQNFISVPAPVFRRSAWRDCGGMDSRLWYTADWDVWAKLAGKGPVYYHDEVTTAFRVHGSSLTVSGSRNAGDFHEQMRIVLERHMPRLAAGSRRKVEPAARASIRVNVSLAAASGGNWAALADAIRHVVALGPAGLWRYMRDSRLLERTLPRLRAKLARSF